MYSCWTARSIAQIEVLFPTLLEKLFWWFQWSRGSNLWPNNTVNTKFCVKIFLGTQSVSRPKRDSIYSFMRHSGPLGCITTEIFSENHCCLKRRFSENLDSTVSTGQLEQNMTVFAIFHNDWPHESLWKIAKTVIFCSS